MKDSQIQLLELFAAEWQKETMFSSAPEWDHRYYKAVIAWGKHNPDEIIPWLLKTIEEHWFWCGALWEIVGQEKGPDIPSEYMGQGAYITQAWLAWGKKNNYL